MVNWKNLVKTQKENLRDFANGEISGRDLTRAVSFTDNAGDVRELLRKHGVDKARKLVRRALNS